MNLKRSLFAKYLLIVLSALVLLPLTFPIVSLMLYFPFTSIGSGMPGPYQDGLKLEKAWRQEAAALGDAATDAEVDRTMRRLKERYPEAGMFWVDKSGRTRLHLSPLSSPPAQWTAAYTVSFMKERTGGDPFTVVSFIGTGRDEGFMVLELPRSLMEPPLQRASSRSPYIFISGSLLVLGLFLFISLMFFYRIRKRLVRLETAMTGTSADGGIPAPVAAETEDEIGRLEAAFNEMVRKLEDSRKREAEEEALRRDLIAKLSHDLRTPLTAINGHAYNLRSEPLSAKGQESVALIERKIGYLGQLIDNLLSYSLLSAGKYPYRPQPVDIVRTARTLFAGWYPAFERESFEIDADFPDAPVYWTIDPAWLERVLDNYFQNVLRHAKTGRYIGFRVEPAGGGAVVISDRGPGLRHDSSDKGSGLGLSIAALMLKEMKLRAVFSPSPGGGTTIVIAPLSVPLAPA